MPYHSYFFKKVREYALQRYFLEIINDLLLKVTLPSSESKQEKQKIETDRQKETDENEDRLR